MEKTAKFWDGIALRYSRQPIADEVSYEKKLEVTRQYFHPDMEVLEIGCGTGSTALRHAPYVRHIRAVDFSAKMIDIASDKAEAADINNVTFECGAIDDLDIADQSVDAVMAHSILHLVEDRDAVIKKIYGMLKPGGVLITSTACLGDSMSYMKPIVFIGKLLGLAPSIVKFFTAKELAKSITDAGFKIDHQWQPGKGKSVFIVAKKDI